MSSAVFRGGFCLCSSCKAKRRGEDPLRESGLGELLGQTIVAEEEDGSADLPEGRREVKDLFWDRRRRILVLPDDEEDGFNQPVQKNGEEDGEKRVEVPGCFGFFSHGISLIVVLFKKSPTSGGAFLSRRYGLMP